MAKGIVIIHGMGEQEPGDCLISVVNPLADYLEGSTIAMVVNVGGNDQLVVDFRETTYELHNES